MNREFLLTAIGCGRVPGIINISEEHSFAVFGTMDDRHLKSIAEFLHESTVPFPVYFYETG